MKKFNRYKVNASEVGDLMSNAEWYRLPSDDDFKEFHKIMNKNPYDVTENQIIWLQTYVSKTVDYEKHGAPISTTAMSHVCRHYAYARFGASKLSKGGEMPLTFEKGDVAEPSAIKLLSAIDGVEYKKNEKLFSSLYFKGIPDIVLTENEKIVGVKDVKVPIDLVSFMEKVINGPSSDDKWEMRAYLEIFGLKEGEICYCLVNMPEEVQKRRIDAKKEQMISNGYSPERIAATVKIMKRSMNYDYIPKHQRVIRFIIGRQNYFTSQLRKRVKAIREKMQLLHEKFENPLILTKMEEILLKSTD